MLFLSPWHVRYPTSLRRKHARSITSHRLKTIWNPMTSPISRAMTRAMFTPTRGWNRSGNKSAFWTAKLIHQRLQPWPVVQFSKQVPGWEQLLPIQQGQTFQRSSYWRRESFNLREWWSRLGALLCKLSRQFCLGLIWAGLSNWLQITWIMLRHRI